MHARDAPDATNAVAASDVTRRYGEEATAVDALRGVSLAVGMRELVAVMGPSGSGKSTLMHVLAGLDKPTQGSVQIAGVEITAMDDAALTRLRREHIGFVFQFFNLLPMLSAEENIVLPLAIAGEHADREWLEELLARTGLSQRRTHLPAELSGGEQQRCAVARALVHDPSLVLADEPSGNLDHANSDRLHEVFFRLAREYETAVVVVTHNRQLAARADRILMLEDGRLAAVASVDAIP